MKINPSAPCVMFSQMYPRKFWSCTLPSEFRNDLYPKEWSLSLITTFPWLFTATFDGNWLLKFVLIVGAIQSAVLLYSVESLGAVAFIDPIPTGCCNGFVASWLRTSDIICGNHHVADPAGCSSASS